MAICVGRGWWVRVVLRVSTNSRVGPWLLDGVDGLALVLLLLMLLITRRRSGGFILRVAHSLVREHVGR